MASQAAHSLFQSGRFGMGSAAYSSALSGNAMLGFARTCKSASISSQALDVLLHLHGELSERSMQTKI